MSYLMPVIIIFSVVAGIDYIIGNRLKLGDEFKRAFMLMGTMMLSMTGMIIIAPFIGECLSPFFGYIYKIFRLDPSIVPAILFANDMGGAPLAMKIAVNADMGAFNGLVVSSMMGATISFTIPFAIGIVSKEKHREMFLGLLCGLVTIPVGCLVAGLICGLPIISLLIDLLPLIIFSVIVAIGVIKAPNFCVKVFKIFGFLLTALIIVGLVLGIVEFLTEKKVLDGLATIEEGALVSLNASIVLSGMFPLVKLLACLLKKPLKHLGKKLGINEESAIGFVSTVASNATTIGIMDKMDKKGVMLNSAFAVSASFVVGSHLAFTMAVDVGYVLPVIVGKLVAGILAVAVAEIFSKFVLEDKKCLDEKK